MLHKFSLLFTTIYIVLFFSNADPARAFLAIWMSLILSFGIAGIGYLFNDLHDMDQDFISNKQNFFNDKNKLKNILLWGLFSACSTLPWLVLPFNQYILGGILLEFILFFLYSSPPFRLKERGIWGVVTDALYAHVIPCFLAGYTFTKITFDMSVISFHTLLFLGWLLLMGCRNILNHQLEDHENDRLSGTNTVAIQMGKEKLSRLIHFVIIPIEWGLFVSFLYFLPFPNKLVLAIYLFYMSLYFIRRRKQGFHKLIQQPGLISKNKDLSKFINNNLMNEFYEIHYPIVLLAYFSIYKQYFVVLLLLHLLLFFPMYVTFFTRK